MSLIATQNDTQVVVTRGVGDHTIMGFTLDSHAVKAFDVFGRSLRDQLFTVSDLETQI